ncbi:MAG: hypothetical protein PVS3B3_23700 [Ktedonobacteraceae bacterium]
MHFEDGVEVFPGHVVGSLCGRGMNAKTSSTIGFERKHNSALTPRTRAAFVTEMNTNLPQRPPNMGNIVEHNRQNYMLQSAPSEPLALDVPAFQQARDNGAQVLDTRSPQAFGEGHKGNAVLLPVPSCRSMASPISPMSWAACLPGQQQALSGLKRLLGKLIDVQCLKC